MNHTKEKPPGMGPSGSQKLSKSSNTKRLTYDSDRIKADLIHALRDRIEEVAQGELGEPSQRTKREWRYGTRGSVVVKRAGQHRGSFYNFEAGEGGDPISLIMYARAIPFKEALKVGLQYVGGIVPETPVRPTKPPKPEPDDTQRRQWARDIGRECVPIRGTLAETYLFNRGRDIRGLELDHCLRFHKAKRMMVARMVDPVTGSFTGIHRTFLDEHGVKLDRRMLGKRGVICLTPYEEVTMGLGITEGIEDAMLWLRHGWPVWAVTCADAIRRFFLESYPEGIGKWGGRWGQGKC